MPYVFLQQSNTGVQKRVARSPGMCRARRGWRTAIPVDLRAIHVITPIGGSLGDFVKNLLTVECPSFLPASRHALGVAEALIGLVW
eukprot:7993600-Pyramimonas_sp.AAC.1